MTSDNQGTESAGLVLATSIADVQLRELTVAQARELFALIQRNRAHLTQYGDYEDLAAASLSEIEQYFLDPPDANIRMGIWRRDELMGRVDLNPVAPEVFVLGYWLGSAYTGNGYMTEACRALIDHARSTLGAREFWAGVRHTNPKSQAVVERLGFSVYENLPERARMRLEMK